MGESHREWIDRFSDYLAGDLDETTTGRIEEHLGGCGACRRVLEELRAVVAGARGLQDRTPPRDLWPGIAAAIRQPVRAQAEPRGAEVIALHGAGLETVRGDRARIAFTPPQLAAAAVLLVALSAVTTWWAGPGLGVRPPATDVAEAPAPGGPEVAVVSAAASVAAPDDALSAELATLEDLLASARGALDPNTVRVIERNLAVIEQAIDDSRQALALDPENAFLAQHLERVYERKLTYLRDAARVLDWAG